MTISFHCPHCQRRYNVAQTLAGKRVKCRGCGRTISTPNGETLSPSSRSPATGPGWRRPASASRRREQQHADSRRAPIRFMVILGVLGVTAGFRYWWTYGEVDVTNPSTQETSAEKHSATREAFGTSSSGGSAPTSVDIDIDIDIEKERATVEQTVRAIVAARRQRDGNEFLELVDLRRIMNAIASHGFREILRVRWRRRYAKELGSAISDMITGDERPWQEHEIHNVVIHADRGEAEAYCTMKFGDADERWKVRLFLASSSSGWKLYDWENLERGIRATVVFAQALILNRRGTDFGQLGAAVEDLRTAGQKLDQGDPSLALEYAERARAFCGEAEILLADIALIEARALLQLGKYEACARRCMTALHHRLDFPIVLLTRAQAALALRRFKDARATVQQYLDQLGDDAEALSILGQAHEGLGDRAAARAAYERGIAADEAVVDNHYGLAFLLTADQPDRAAGLLEKACAQSGSEDDYATTCDRLLEASAFGPLVRLAQAFGQRYPMSHYARFLHGVGLANVDQLSEAQRKLEAAVRLAGKDEPTAVPLRYTEELCLVLLRTRQPEMAEALIDQLPDHDAAEVSGHYARAYMLALDSKPEEAFREAQQASIQVPRYLESLRRLPVFSSVREHPGFAALVRFVERNVELERRGQLSESCSESLLEARANHKPELLDRKHEPRGPAATPPQGIFEPVRYDTPAGKLVGYLSPDPKDGKRHPALVWAHGGFRGIGAWLWQEPQYLQAFRDAGIVVFCPSWRGENDNPGRPELFYGEVDDALAAINYVAALEYVDPRRIYMAGRRAGGTLCLLVALASDKLRGAFPVGGAPDLWRMVRQGKGYDDIPFPFQDRRESYLRSPIHFVSSLRVPTFYFEWGNSVYVEPAQRMQELAVAAKTPFQACIIAGGNHVDIVAPATAIIAKLIQEDREANASLADVRLDQGRVQAYYKAVLESNSRNLESLRKTAASWIEHAKDRLGDPKTITICHWLKSTNRDRLANARLEALSLGFEVSSVEQGKDEGDALRCKLTREHPSTTEELVTAMQAVANLARRHGVHTAREVHIGDPRRK